MKPFKPEAPYQKHSETSEAAAKAIEPHLNSLQAKVLSYLKTCKHGSTDEDGINALRMSPSTYRPRRIELMDLKLVIDSGRRDVLKSGRRGVVWEIVPEDEDDRIPF